MSEPFVGEIRMFAGNFAPRNWAFCDGQLLAISQNDALFSLFGTIYGGDGRTTFGLPDMRGRIPVHAGHGPGLTPRNLGSKSGNEVAYVSENQLPAHNHSILATASDADSSDPEGNLTASTTNYNIYSSASPGVNMAVTAAKLTGNNSSHSNMMPSLCIHFIVALIGIYPSRS